MSVFFSIHYKITNKIEVHKSHWGTPQNKLQSYWKCTWSPLQRKLLCMSRRKVQQWVSHAVSAVVANLYMLWGGIQVPEVLLPDYSTHTGEATAAPVNGMRTLLASFRTLNWRRILHMALYSSSMLLLYTQTKYVVSMQKKRCHFSYLLPFHLAASILPTKLMVHFAKSRT